MITKASAAVVTPIAAIFQQEHQAVWPNLRSEFDQSDSDHPLNPKLEAIVRATNFEEDFEATIRLSYSMISSSHVKTLDRLWISTLLQLSGSEAIAKFLAVRATIAEATVAGGREEYLENWVWQIAKKGESEGS